MDNSEEASGETENSAAATAESPSSDAVVSIPSHADMVRSYREYVAPKAKKGWAVDETLHRDLEAGWMRPYLFGVDRMLHHRWDYWAAVQSHPGYLPQELIPPLELTDSAPSEGRAMLTRCLNAVCAAPLSGDTWMGWSSFENFQYMLDWLLFGFGHQGFETLSPEPSPGASMRLYQLFDLWPLLLFPYDHLADLLAECKHGRQNQFYPTPHSLAKFMRLVVMGGDREKADCRTETVCEPACGTGRILLEASNRSLRLYGEDIDRTMVKCTLVNGYLFAPWLAVPIWWMDGTTLRRRNTLLMDEGEKYNGDDEAYQRWVTEARRLKTFRDLLAGNPPFDILRSEPVQDEPNDSTTATGESGMPTTPTPEIIDVVPLAAMKPQLSLDLEGGGMGGEGRSAKGAQAPKKAALSEEEVARLKAEHLTLLDW